MVGVIGLILSVVVPPLVKEMAGLLTNLKDNPILSGGSQTISDLLANSQDILKNLTHNFAGGDISLIGNLGKVLGGVATVIFTLVISFYMTLDDESIKGFINSLVPEAFRNQANVIIEKIQKTLGRWVKAQLVLGIIVGLLVFIGLFLLGNKYAVSLAILSGMFELVPILGPLLAAVPGILIAYSFSQDLILTILTLGCYIIVQQVENHFIVPNVMRKAVDLDPILVLVAILIGGNIAGFAGVLLAVPATAAIIEFVKGSTGFELKLRRKIAKS